MEKEEAGEINPGSLKPDLHYYYDIVSEDKKENEPRYEEERSMRPVNQVSVPNVAKIDQKFAELIEKEEGGLHRCTVCEKKIRYKLDITKL